MQCSSFKMALCHDRMYIIGLLACADHFTTKLSTQSQTHTSRSPSFNVDSGRACVCTCVRMCEREWASLPSRICITRGKQDTLLNLFWSFEGKFTHFWLIINSLATCLCLEFRVAVQSSGFNVFTLGGRAHGGRYNQWAKMWACSSVFSDKLNQSFIFYSER